MIGLIGTICIYIVCAIVIFLFGICCGKALAHSKTVGVFRIDRNNPDRDIFRLDFSVDPHDMPKRKYFVFKVDNHADLSVADNSADIMDT